MQTHAGADPFGIAGQVLDGQFRVDRLVGEGGFSAVYRGHHLGLDEPIAIKCLKLPPNLSPPLVEQFAKRFRDESRILYRLSQGNLNIVRSIAAGTWTALTGLVVPYMILEWMEGRSLANEFTIRRTVGNLGRPLTEVVKVFGSAADGLAYAHAQGVVHRDLNPGNLFLAATPQGTKMKVLDFGVAKILDDSTLNIGPRTQTVGHIRIFAPAYGAPEQFDDSIGPVGAASDVYSFALILLEALRDRSVNDGAHLGEFAQRAIDPNLRPTPRSLGIDVTAEVEQIFVRATKLDPRERWQSAGELWQALAIAANAASQQRHAQAALETPPLNLAAARGTKTGMGPPPQKTSGTGRMEKTMPLGAIAPKLRLPGMPGDPTSSDSQTRVPAVVPRPPGVGVDTIRSASGPHDAGEGEGDEPTKVGARQPMTPRPGTEEEVTRIRSPDAEMLRNFGDTQTPRPAAGAPADKPFAGTVMMPSGVGFPPGPQPPPPPPIHAPPPPQARPPFAGTMPLTGPMAGPAGPPPHAPPPQAAMHAGMSGPSPSHPHPHHPQAPMQASAQAPYQMAAAGHPNAFSLPPGSTAGVPKKSSAMIVIGVVLGLMVVVGGIGIGVYLRAGQGNAGLKGISPASSSIAVATTAPEASSGATPTPPTATAAEVEADAGEAPVPSATESTPSPPATAETPPSNPAPAPAPAPPPTERSPVNNGGSLPVPAAKDAGPPLDPNAFNEPLARSRLAQANSVLVFCNKNGVTGPGSAAITFNPDGTVGSVALDPPYAGTPTGDCVTGQFKRAKISSFVGAAHMLRHTFDVPK